MRFFDGLTPQANTILAHIHSDRHAIPLEFTIQLPIIDTLIGDMFFHPDDQGGTTQTAALKLFKCIDDVNESYYMVVILYPAQFSLVVAYVSRGVSFRQCTHILADTKRILGTIHDAIKDS